MGGSLGIFGTGEKKQTTITTTQTWQDALNTTITSSRVMDNVGNTSITLGPAWSGQLGEISGFGQIAMIAVGSVVMLAGLALVLRKGG